MFCNPEKEKAAVKPHEPVMTAKSMEAAVNYDGVVLTSVDVVAPDPANPKRVVFSDITPADVNDKDAVFLCNIREVSRTGEGYATIVDFEAELLTPQEAQAKIAAETNSGGEKALFVMHGFNTNASFHLADCLFAKPKFVKTDIIPIIWPSEGSGSYFDYREDRQFSAAAGKALQSMQKPLQLFREAGIRSSIVCHSMGNRVFRNFSNPDIDFDNIFMVAADVPATLFLKDYIDGAPFLGFGDDLKLRQHGLNIKQMLADPEEGKIHILYNGGDSRMFQSKIMNLGSRLGGVGVDMDNVHEELKSCIVNVDCGKPIGDPERMLYESEGEHNYHFFDDVVKYYEENA